MTSADTRYLIGEGDKTGTGGYQSASSTSTNMGKRIALEGDYASCPACKAGGPVYNDCDPRWYENGKAVLVEGSRVFCQCKRSRVFLPRNARCPLRWSAGILVLPRRRSCLLHNG